MFVSNNPDHTIQRIQIGKLYANPDRDPRFKIIIRFEDDQYRSELTSPKEILDRVNLWESVKHWDANKARQYMTDLILPFTWPVSVWARPLKVKSFEVFYYDARGLKYYTTLGEA